MVQPESIAVAYVGADWESFVDADTLKEIIVSPTAGSSADAIAERVWRLSWSNMHFLNKLQAKIYLSKTSAAIGNFNLTANGLSGHALEEAGYVFGAPVQLKSMRTLYASFKTKAAREYHLQSKKGKQLSQLKEINAKLRDAGLSVPASSRGRMLTEYEPLIDTDFYCAFFFLWNKIAGIAKNA